MRKRTVNSCPSAKASRGSQNTDAKNKVRIRLQDVRLGGDGLQGTAPAAHTVSLMTASHGARGDPLGLPASGHREGRTRDGTVATHSGLPRASRWRTEVKSYVSGGKVLPQEMVSPAVPTGKCRTGKLRLRGASQHTSPSLPCSAARRPCRVALLPRALTATGPHAEPTGSVATGGA